MEIRLIPAWETHALRRDVLRQGDPSALVEWPGDEHPEGFHLGAFIGPDHVGIASFRPEHHPALIAHAPFRLRGMATRADRQGQGIGQAILHKGFAELRARGADLLWCNAREKAARFYSSAGLAATGAPFVIEGIGLHYLMHIAL